MAFRTQKISQMTPKGANLEATDLIEVSTIESGSYVTRSITGQEIIDGIPPAAAAWGSITGTLSSQTDLQSALNAKQDTLTLTTTGTSGAATLVGSTLNIPQYSGGASGITIGTTAITSGTVGRILFEGTGNVVQESGNLFWDNTNVRLGIGTSTPSHALTIEGASQPSARLVDTTNGAFLDLNIGNSDGLITSSSRIFIQSSTTLSVNATNVGIGVTNPINAKFQVVGTVLFSSGNVIMNSTSGNTLIGTTTDAGFRLDVNGTARVSGELRAGNLQILTSGNAGATGQGIVVTGTDTTFQFNGSPNPVDMFQFRSFQGITGTSTPVNSDKNIVRIYGGFNSGSISNLSGNTLSITPTYNLTGNATIVRGIYYNPTLTSLTNGTHFAFHSTSGRVRFEGLPTSSAGLSAGDIWNDGGTLKIV